MSEPPATEPAPPLPAPRGLRPRLAGSIAAGLGLIAAAATAFAPRVAWWMPLLVFAVVGVVVWRILRPLPRRIDVVDEI